MSHDPASDRATDPVGLTWLVTGRWTTLAAAAGAVLAGRSGLDARVPVLEVAFVMSAITFSNLWLWWRISRDRRQVTTAAGLLLCADVVLLSWLLLQSGGVLNPASAFYLVDIVLAALVLGRIWAWGVAALSVGGYAALLVTPTEALRAAQRMHPEIATHMRGMWVAFALTGVIIAVLVTRLVIAIERRDRALDELRERGARASRIAGLTTAVAGAAHELSTPLATMAVVARELERSVGERGVSDEIVDDARLIRSEIDRCRAILEQMAGRGAEPLGEAPTAMRVAGVLEATLREVDEPARQRIVTTVRDDTSVLWPKAAVVQAFVNVIRNALQASPPDRPVEVHAATEGGAVRITVVDHGVGMTAEDRARAGEPFFTTKPAGAGTGVGLFVARSTVEQLGGDLVLASEAGHGTRVTMTLPHDVLRRPGAPA
jgi:two-component system sensor histidine kinase RegB